LLVFLFEVLITQFVLLIVAVLDDRYLFAPVIALACERLPPSVRFPFVQVITFLLDLWLFTEHTGFEIQKLIIT